MTPLLLGLVLWTGVAHATDADGDGYGTAPSFPADCKDSGPGAAAINPNADEAVGDTVDQDCDGHDGLNRGLLVSGFPSAQWTDTGVVTFGTGVVTLGTAPPRARSSGR